MLTRVTIIGAAGRMGQELLQCIQQSEDLVAAGLVVEPKSPLVGSAPLTAAHLVYTDSIERAAADADILLDFSAPGALGDLLATALLKRLPVVCGTTGFSRAQFDALRSAGEVIPVFHSPNMSVGIQVMADLVDLAVSSLGAAYDVELLEIHHRFKRDAPSGTALRLSQVVKTALARLAGATDAPPAAGPIQDPPVHSIRGGDVVGDHAVHLMGQGERIEIIHRATSRRTLALGALRAARWLIGQTPGYYSMADLLKPRGA